MRPTHTKRVFFQRNAWLLFPVAFLAGLTNGFFGAGGGMVFAVALPLFFEGEDTGNLFAYTALGVFFASCISASIYLAEGRMSLAAVSANILPAAVGGAVGGYLLTKISPTLLKGAFALLLIYSGVRFLWGS